MYSVSPLTQDHINPVKSLWQDRLGAPDTYIDTWLSGVFTTSPTTGYIAQHNDTRNIVGVGIACLGTPEYVIDYLNHPQATTYDWNDPTGIIHSLAVEPTHESNGVATQLVQNELHWFETHGCEVVTAVSWHRDAYRDSRPLFEKFEFEPIYTSDDFFKEATGDAHCVDCEGACTCGGTIYVRQL